MDQLVGPLTVVPPAPAPVVRLPGQGPRAKQFGMPSEHIVHLEPAYLPSDAEWLRSQVGLVLGVAVQSGSIAILSYNPALLPKMQIRQMHIVAELAADQPGAEASVRAIFLGRDGNPLALGDPKAVISLVGFPRVSFPVPMDQVAPDTLLTVALEVKPLAPGKRAIVRAVWARIEA